MNTFKILCIDGGGIKGLFSAQVLAKYEEVFNTNVSDHFDLICGTSTGGIIALAASAKIPMSDLVKFYDQKGPVIFAESSKWCKAKRGLMSLKQALCKCKYDGKILENALVEVFGAKTLGQSSNLLCIPAYDITTAKTRIFKKDYKDLTEDSSKKYVDVALATSAAPTYLPVKEIDTHEYIDGGIWANNPIIVGLTEFLFKHCKPVEERTEDDYSGVEILSISTCETSQGQIEKKKNRSFLGWKDSLFDSYSRGQSLSSMFFIDKLKPFIDFDLKVKRIVNQPLSPEQQANIDMDNASEKSRKALIGLGIDAALYSKNDPEIIKFFSEQKTYK